MSTIYRYSFGQRELTKSLYLPNVTGITYTWKVNNTKATSKRRAKEVRAVVRRD